MRAKVGKRKSISIPKTTLDAITSKMRRRTAIRSLKTFPIPTQKEQYWLYHSKVSKRFMQKISGRAMELMKITDKELKAKMHRIAMRGIMEERGEHEKARAEMVKLIGEEKTKEFFDLVMKIGDANIGKIRDY